MNFGFSTGSAGIGLPNDAAVGVAYGSMITDNMYAIVGITDTNGDPSDPFTGFDNFFSDNEYFTSAEIGWLLFHNRDERRNHIDVANRGIRDAISAWPMADYSHYDENGKRVAGTLCIPPEKCGVLRPHKKGTIEAFFTP